MTEEGMAGIEAKMYILNMEKDMMEAVPTHEFHYTETSKIQFQQKSKLLC